MTSSVYAEFSWSQLPIFDKDVTFLLAEEKHLPHGNFSSHFEKKKEGQRVFLASVIFQMPLTQNTRYAKVAYLGWYVLKSQKPWKFWYIEMWEVRYLRVFCKSSCYFKFFRKGNTRSCTLSDYLNVIFHFPSQFRNTLEICKVINNFKEISKPICSILLNYYHPYSEAIDIFVHLVHILFPPLWSLSQHQFQPQGKLFKSSFLGQSYPKLFSRCVYVIYKFTCLFWY